MRALITGANRGIGRAIAEHMAARGDAVLRTARAADGHMALDVTDPASIETLAARIADAPLDLLVCNAGVFLEKGRSREDYAPELWAETFAVNVTGVFLCVEALLPVLRQAKTPKIAIISSQMASSTHAPGGSYIYRASKAAALNLGRNMASDFKPLGIAVGIYHPGWVRTDMGGAQADISEDEAARGLIARFDALSLETTGCFETWDGRAHAY
ncbi:SDR family oxidoreductase [Cognatishimia sp. F0-27]|uniref:SDR family oxidoreductase n=1 Tax=Cognatishimia sp. F0-27 TaxID=2816855 RepID=UPI001D0CAC66|nr:SDR family oxidoreductase [Cognatishimia sp. F0-27]MCC1494887.1 SDR family oxidoreductase [Cognatishimia sp. F0-27]